MNLLTVFVKVIKVFYTVQGRKKHWNKFNEKFREHIFPTYPSFQGAEARRLGVRRHVRQPESCRHMHDEADRVSVLDLRHSHAVNVPLRAQVALFLLTLRRAYLTAGTQGEMHLVPAENGGAEIWQMEKYYDRVVIREAGWEECVHWPAGRLLPASLARLHSRSAEMERCRWLLLTASSREYISASVQHGKTRWPFYLQESASSGLHADRWRKETVNCKELFQNRVSFFTTPLN